MSNEVTTRQKLQTIGQTILPSARVELGIEDADAESLDFMDTILTSGPFLIFSPANMLSFDSINVWSTFSIVGKLYFGLAPDVDNNFITIETLAFQLRNAFILTTNWSSANLPPWDLKMTRKMLPSQKPIQGCYIFDIIFRGPIC